MLDGRRFASSALIAAAFSLPAAAFAQQALPPPPATTAPPPAPAPRSPPPTATAASPFAPLPPTAVRLGPTPLPYYPGPSNAELPPERPRPQRWYGAHVLIPTGISDALLMGGALGALSTSSGSGATVGAALAITGLAGHALSAPIVHLAHGHPLKALASFGLEAALPALALGLGIGLRCSGGSCPNVPILLFLVPLTLTAGPAVDASILAWEDPPRAGDDAATRPTVRVAPLVLPPLRTGAGGLAAPAGVSLVGTF